MTDKDRLEHLKDRINRCPFNQANGIQAFEALEGCAQIKVALGPDSRNIWGITHGGLLFSAADVAAGLAAQTLWDGTTVTVSANVNYLRASRDAKELLASAKVQKSGRSMSFCSVRVYDDCGQLLMTGQYVLHHLTNQ